MRVLLKKMHQAHKTAIDIIEYGRLTIVAMTMIVVVYLVAKSLFGQVPATIGSLLFGIGGVYILATNKKVKDKINSWLGQK